MKWYKNKILKKLFLTTTDWNAGWKFKNNETYNIIDNPDGYWLADSMIFKTNSDIFLFVEAYDKIKQIGKLGVLKYVNGKFTDFKIILEKNYHLSYPYVFKIKNRYFMIPETSANHTIELYESKKFPYDWEKIKDLAYGDYVDTTVYLYDDEYLKFFTYNEKNRKEYVGMIKISDFSVNFTEKIEDKKHCLRGGGNVFALDGKLCRPLQNNTYFYGQSLNVVECETNCIINKILPSKLKNNKCNIYKRVHTYSCSGDVEAIDVSSYKFDILKIPKKIFKKRRFTL